MSKRERTITIGYIVWFLISSAVQCLALLFGIYVFYQGGLLTMAIACLGIIVGLFLVTCLIVHSFVKRRGGTFWRTLGRCYRDSFEFLDGVGSLFNL